MIVVQNKPSSTLSTRPPISSRWWHVLVFRGWYSQCWKFSWKSYRTAGPVSVTSFRSYWEVLGPTNEGQRPESERHRREALLGGVRGHNHHTPPPPQENLGEKMGQFGGNLVNFAIKPWWRHQMETFSALLALCAGNFIHFTCIYICQINNFTNISPSFSTQGEMRSLMISFYLSFKIFEFFVKLLICMLRNWCSVTVDV